LWIFDILSTEREWIAHVKRNDVPVVCFDDLKGGLDAADLVINPIAGYWINTEIPQGGRILSGPDYAVIDSLILTVRKGKQLPSEAIRVGVTMGGSDTHGSTVKVAGALTEIEESLEVTLFLGPCFSHKQELREITHKVSFPYSIRNEVRDLHKELVESDAVICGGGQTLFELCAMGMPVLALANEPHEEKTISYFSGHGACVGIGSIHRTIDSVKIGEFLKKLRSEPTEVQRMITSAQKLVDGRGTSRCYHECVKIIK
jgi:spore coat polysaccharide biosynthesis predicted glycosyltransferase SpsG